MTSDVTFFFRAAYKVERNSRRRKTVDELSDETLLNQYFKGDAKAFREFYKRHAGRVSRFAKRKGFSEEAADEIAQESFLRLHRSIHSYEHGRPALAWFFTIVHNCIIDAHRQQNRSRKIVHDVIENERSASPRELDHDYDLSSALLSLTAEQKRVVEKKVFDELTFQEMSLSMKKSEVSLRKTFERAKAKMKAILLGGR